MPDFNQLNLAQVYGAADEDRATQIRNALAQDQLGRDFAFRNMLSGLQQQPTAVAGVPGQTSQAGATNINQLFAIDPERAMQYTKFQAEQNQLQRQARIDNAKQIYDKVSYVLQSKDPKGLVEAVYPEWVNQWESAHGPGSWEKLSDTQARNAAQALLAHYGAEAGIAPTTEKIDSGGSTTIYNPTTNETLASIPKTVTPGEELSSQTTRRGQDITAATAKRGQDIELAKLTQQGGQQYQNTAEKLRSDYAQLTQQTGFHAVQGSYDRLKRSVADPSAAGDLALIFSYMKILDPTSVVREGEFATAANSGSAWNKVGSVYNKVLSGERLTEPQRADFMKQASKIYDTAYQRQQSIDQDYSDKAKRANINPADVIVNYGQIKPDASSQVSLPKGWSITPVK